MNFLYFVLISILSGIFAGMGMGGGTFLIPLITLIMGVDQKVASATNLLVFIPMAIISIFIYKKQNLIDFKNFWIISLPALIVSVLGALLAVNISSKLLKIIFGAFILIIGVVQIVCLIIKKVKNKKKAVKNHKIKQK